MQSRRILETDAIPTMSDVVRRPQVIEREDSNEIISQSLNMRQTTTMNHITINNATGIILKLGDQRHVSDVDARNNSKLLEKEVYRKTPTIKIMMESTEAVRPDFLDLVASNLGKRWKVFAYHLEKNPMFMERMEADLFDRGGTKEIIMQVLTKFFQENKEKKTVGWLTTFLWNYGFRKTVYQIKGPYIKLREIDSD